MMQSESPEYAIAIVGAGIIGSLHARTCQSIPGLTVVAVIDPVEANASALQESIEADTGVSPLVFSNLGAALEESDIDVVVICTPTGYHATTAVLAIAAGKHVLIEKPLDVSPRSAATVVDAARAHPELVTAVISQKRFDRSNEIVHDAVAAGEFGRITSAVVIGALWRSQEYYDMGEWRGTWKLDGGGALMNQGVHSIDLLVWFLGKPKTVAAKVGLLAHENIEVEDTAVAIIEFDSGALATVQYSTASYPGTLPRISVFGSRGSAIIDSDQLAFYHSASSGVEVGQWGIAPGGNQADDLPPAPPTDPGIASDIVGHRNQYLDFLTAIQGGDAPRVGVEDAYLSLATVGAIYESARRGTPVDFDEYLADITREG